MSLFFCLLFLLVSSATAQDCDRQRCVPQSKVAYFPETSAFKSGACGYGSLAVEFDSGHIAAAIPSIYKDGAGCGACYQIRCKNPKLCTKKGTRVVVTDLQQSNQTDFVLSRRAFTAMAQEGKGSDLRKLGLVDVEYKRVPCDYQNKNFSVRVEESSQKPNYLAIKFLYQGGQTDILVLEVAPENPMFWKSMSRNHGAVWDTGEVPSGPLQLRFAVLGGYDARWYTLQNVLPADWKNGMICDTGVKITEIAQDGCSPCDDGSWN